MVTISTLYGGLVVIHRLAGYSVLHKLSKRHNRRCRRSLRRNVFFTRELLSHQGWKRGCAWETNGPRWAKWPLNHAGHHRATASDVMERPLTFGLAGWLRCKLRVSVLCTSVRRSTGTQAFCFKQRWPRREGRRVEKPDSDQTSTPDGWIWDPC